MPDPRPSLIERLYAEHRAALHSFFRRRIRNQAHAADLAVVLRFTHDLSYRQIAAHIGVSTQMAKKYVARGLEQCQRRLAGLG